MSEKFIDFREIKQLVSIEAVLDHYNIKLRHVNKTSLRGPCPLPTHSSDKSVESFSVQIEKNIWACQSTSCVAARSGKRGGNVIDFVAVMENSSIRDAAQKLHEWFVQSPSETSAKKQPAKKKISQLVAEKNSTPQKGESEVVTNKPLTFTLKDVDATHPYIHQRGIKVETAQHFGVGFFPGRGSMVGRVVIPIHNERGELVAYAGRAIDDTEPKYKLPAGFVKSAVLFNLHRVNSNMVIVVEGFFDCMKVHQAGFPDVVALMGSSLSAEQEELLHRFTQVVLFLDGDDAGKKASQSIAMQLLPRVFVRLISLPGGEQPDQLSSNEIKTILSP